MANILNIRKRIVRKKKEQQRKVRNGKPIEIRDSRDREFFFVDNLFLDQYALIVGTHTLCVYLSLCRHVNKDQTCFPSIDLICDEMGSSTKTVVRGLKQLEFHHIIKIDRVKGEANIYTLLNRRHWRKAIIVKRYEEKRDAMTNYSNDWPGGIN